MSPTESAKSSSAPKYSKPELERKWLVAADNYAKYCGDVHDHIEDLYITGTRLRLRRVQPAVNQAAIYKLGKKYATEQEWSRHVTSLYLTVAEYERFSVLPGARLAKRRYHLMHAQRPYALDVFEGPLQGLVLSEIECADEADLATAPTPPWALREVTDVPDFSGARLAIASAAASSPAALVKLLAKLTAASSSAMPR